MKKFSHDEWIQKFSNNFKVEILGQYINSRSKILCRCRCGTEKFMKPNYIKDGRLCDQSCHNNYYDKLLQQLSSKFIIKENFGNKYTLECKKCNNNFSTLRRHDIECENCKTLKESNNNELQNAFKQKIIINFRIINEQNIKKRLECLKCKHIFVTNVYSDPICSNCEKYNKNIRFFDILNKNNITIIDNITPYNLVYKKKYNMMCSCGKEIFNSVHRIIKTLNCKYCRIPHTPNPVRSYTNKQTIIYYVRFENFYKIGVTLHKLKYAPEQQIMKRFSRYGEKVPDEIINYQIFKNGIDAYNLEQCILNKYKKFKLNDPIVGGGWTEYFKIDIFKTNVEIDLNESKYLNDKLMIDFVNFSKGKSTLEDIEKKTQRDCYMSPEEAIVAGIIDATV